MGKYVLLITMIGLYISCASDTSAAKDLEGRWELTSASIDGEETDRLENLYFEFVKDQVNTNILGADGTYPYELRGGVIQQQSEPEVAYDLLFKSDTTIALSSDIRGRSFVFSLLRAEMLNESSEVL